MFRLHRSLAPGFPFLEEISTRSAALPSPFHLCAVEFHKPVLLGVLCVLPAQLEVATLAPWPGPGFLPC